MLSQESADYATIDAATCPDSSYREAHYIRVTVNDTFVPLFPVHFGSYNKALGGYPVSATAGMRTE